MVGDNIQGRKIFKRPTTYSNILVFACGHEDCKIVEGGNRENTENRINPRPLNSQSVFKLKLKQLL